MAIKLSRKKSGVKITTDRSGKRHEPKWEGAADWNGQQFNTFKHFAFDYYRMETKIKRLYEKYGLAFVRKLLACK